MVFVVDSLIWVANNNNNQRASFFKVQYVEWHSIRRTSVGCVKPSITMTAYYNYIMSLLFWSVLYRRLKTLYSRHMHCSFLLSHCVLADRCSLIAFSIDVFVKSIAVNAVQCAPHVQCE